jgi:hypothetical protein
MSWPGLSACSNHISLSPSLPQRSSIYVPKICYHTKFENSSLSSASATPILDVHLPDHHDCVIDGRKVKTENPLVRNINITFYDNPSTGLKVIREKIW